MEDNELYKYIRSAEYLRLTKPYKHGNLYRNLDYQQTINKKITEQVKNTISALGIELSDDTITDIIIKTTCIEEEKERSRFLLEKGLDPKSIVDYSGDFERSMGRCSEMQADLFEYISSINGKIK